MGDVHKNIMACDHVTCYNPPILCIFGGTLVRGHKENRTIDRGDLIIQFKLGNVLRLN